MNRHIATICLGSNADDGANRILNALLLIKYKGWHVIANTHIYQTSTPYYNCLAYVALAENYDRANLIAKHVEKMMGRTPESKSIGSVPIDIDIVVFDQTIMRPDDYRSDYFQEGLSLLNEACANPYQSMP